MTVRSLASALVGGLLTLTGILLIIFGIDVRTQALGIGVASVGGVSLLVAALVIAVGRAEQFFGALASRRGVFWFQSFYLAGLIAVAVLYNSNDWFAAKLPAHLGPVPIGVPWAGAVGAVTISLSATADHRGDWDATYALWHWSRALVGATFGWVSMIFFLMLNLQATPTSRVAGIPPDLIYYAVAFAVGYREETFRTLLKRLVDLVMAPAGAPRPTITTLTPPSAPSGSTLQIAGTGLTGATVVTFDATPASFLTRSDSLIDVVVPATATTGGRPATSQVTVTTAGGQSNALTFTYSNPAGSEPTQSAA